MCNQDLTTKVFFQLFSSYHSINMLHNTEYRPDTIELLNNLVSLQNQKHKFWLHLLLQWVSHVIACLEWW